MTRKTHFPRMAAGLALAVLPFTAACGDDEVEASAPNLPPVTNSSAPVNQPTTPLNTPSTPPPATGTVGEPGAKGGLSQEALQERIGQTVTVTGEVATIVGPNAFTLGGDEIGENPVLVVSATAPQVDEGDSVRVSGQVIRFSVPGVEEDLDLDIVDNEFEDFDGDPAVQAASVTGAQG